MRACTLGICSFLIIASFLLSCQKPANKPIIHRLTIQYDSLKLISFADSLVCDIVDKSPDNDLQTESFLKHFKKEAFVDTIFNQLYSKRLIAYDFETQMPLTTEDIKEIEKTPGYSRNIIGKFQFNEEWQYDPEKKTMIKQVHSIIFGYEIYTQDRLVKGYKPLFKINLNE